MWGTTKPAGIKGYSLMDSPLPALLRLPIPPRFRRTLRVVFFLVPLWLIARSGVESGALELFAGKAGAEVCQPRSGEHSFPPEVREIQSFIRAQKLADYSLSKAILKRYEGMEIYQRVTEAAWLDAEYSEDSRYRFVDLSEVNKVPGGRVVHKGKYVVLVSNI